MKEPPLNKSPEAKRLRIAATDWGLNVGRADEALARKLNDELLTAALAYANAVYHAQKIYKTTDKIDREPTRWQCVICHRDKFVRRCAHKCVGGYRRRHLKWIPIYEEASENQASDR